MERNHRKLGLYCKTSQKNIKMYTRNKELTAVKTCNQYNHVPVSHIQVSEIKTA